MLRWIISGLLAVVLGMTGGCSSQRLSEKDIVKIVQLSPPDMVKQLKSGEIDGFVAWEPYNTEAVKAATGKYLLKSGDIWQDHPCCVLAVSEQVTEPHLKEALVWAHFKATDFINNPANKEKTLRYAAEFTGKDRYIVLESLAGIKFVKTVDKEQFRNYFNDLDKSKLLKRSLQEIGFSGEEAFGNDFLDQRIYRQVNGKLAVNPSWKPDAVSLNNEIRLGYIVKDLHELQLYIGIKEGYFQSVGLTPGKNLKIKPYANGVAVMEAFKTRELDASYLGGAPATLKRVNDDIKIRIQAGANNEGSAIIVGTGAGIASVRDLAGKTIAVPGIGTVQYFLLDKAVKKEQLKLVVR